MIYFVVKDVVGRYPITMLMADWGRALSSRIRVLDYNTLFRSHRLSLGSYVFTDLEYLDPVGLESTAACWRTLSDSGADLQLLNHPLRVKRRFELLRELRERGINDFNVHRLDAGRLAARFPVFVRGSNDHEGPRSGLLDSQQQIDDELARQSAAGRSTQDWIAVEFSDYRCQDGLFRKYGAFCVAGTIIPRHLIFSREWMTKGLTREVSSELIDEELEFIEANPHAAQLKELFAAAQIDYGRVDYTVHDGQIRVFEINTNPQLVKPGPSGNRRRTFVKERFAERFVAAMSECDCRESSDDSIAVDLRRSPALSARRDWIGGSMRITNAVGLQRFEPQIYRGLFAVRTFWRHHKDKWWQRLPGGFRHALLRHRRG